MNIHQSQLTKTKLAKEDMNALTYFPTLLFKFHIPCAQVLNEELLECIYKEKEHDAKGIQRSNFSKLGGWHSKNNLHKKTEYLPLLDHINDACELISQRLQYHHAHKLQVGTMWSIVNPPGSVNRAHVHPGCDWSGVYYIHAPEKSGEIEFVDPRTNVIMRQPKFIPNKKRPKQCWTKVSFPPTEGTMIIFPSWLYHSVALNESELEGRDGERVIISFNLSQRKRSERK